MDRQTIVTVFGVSFLSSVVSVGLHGRLAGTEGRPCAATMTAFVLDRLSVLAALCRGAFLLMVPMRR
jgi:hypothetical protein